MIRLISNKLLLKRASDIEAPDNDIYIGKHSFQGTTHYGTKSDFAPHMNIMEPLTGPIGEPPKDSTHIHQKVSLLSHNRRHMPPQVYQSLLRTPSQKTRFLKNSLSFLQTNAK